MNFRSSPLILNTRAEPQSGEFSRLLQERGARVLEIPALEIEILPPSLEAEREILLLGAEDYLAVTSSNAARFLATVRSEVKSHLRGIKVAAVGEATGRALREVGLSPALVSSNQTAFGLAQELIERLRGASGRVLFLKGDSAGETLKLELNRAGIPVVSIEVYRSRPAEHLANRIEDSLSAISALNFVTFFSGNSARAFLQALPDAVIRKFLALPTVAAGPTVASTLERLGMRRVEIARVPTSQVVIDTLVRLEGYYSSG